MPHVYRMPHHYGMEWLPGRCPCSDSLLAKACSELCLRLPRRRSGWSACEALQPCLRTTSIPRQHFPSASPQHAAVAILAIGKQSPHLYWVAPSAGSYDGLSYPITDSPTDSSQVRDSSSQGNDAGAGVWLWVVEAPIRAGLRFVHRAGVGA